MPLREIEGFLFEKREWISHKQALARSRAVDKNGASLIGEYMVSCNRSGPSLTYQFCLYLPQGMEEARVELVFGVNEDCGFRFPTLGKLFLHVGASGGEDR